MKTEQQLRELIKEFEYQNKVMHARGQEEDVDACRRNNSYIVALKYAVGDLDIHIFQKRR